MVCSDCAAGKYSGAAATECTDCAAGQNDHDSDAASACQDCAEGQHTGSGGLTSCTACGTGTSNPDPTLDMLSQFSCHPLCHRAREVPLSRRGCEENRPPVS